MRDLAAICAFTAIGEIKTAFGKRLRHTLVCGGQMTE